MRGETTQSTVHKNATALACLHLPMQLLKRCFDARHEVTSPTPPHPTLPATSPTWQPSGHLCPRPAAGAVTYMMRRRTCISPRLSLYGSEAFVHVQPAALGSQHVHPVPTLPLPNYCGTCFTLTDVNASQLRPWMNCSVLMHSCTPATCPGGHV